MEPTGGPPTGTDRSPDGGPPEHSPSVAQEARWAVGIRLIGALAGFGVTALASRLVSGEEFGRYAVAVSVVALGAQVSTGGFGRLFVRDLAPLDAVPGLAALRSARRGLLVFGAAGGLGATAALWILIGTSGGDHVGLLAVAIVLAPLAGLTLVVADLLRAQGRYVLADLLLGRSGSPGALVIAVLVLGGWLLLGIAASATDVLLVQLLVAVPWLGAGLVRLRDVAPRSRMPARSWGAGWGFLSVQMMSTVFTQVALWAAAISLEATDLGLFSGAFRLVSAVSLPLAAAQVVYLPRISRAAARNQLDQLEPSLRRAATVILAAGAVPLLAMTLLPGLVLELALGETFRSGGEILAILALGQMANFGSGLCGNTLLMAGHERLVRKVMGVSAVAVLGLGVMAGLVAGRLALAAVSSLVLAFTYGALTIGCVRLLGVRTYALGPGAAVGELRAVLARRTGR